MSNPWLIIDSHYLCHRAFHTSGGLSYKGKATGTIFGFLKSIAGFKEQFETDNVAFCFEHPHLLRRDLYPEYKLRRRTKPMTPKEAKQKAAFKEQIEKLRTEYLPRIGFNNVFCFDGYESDDIMAAIAKYAPVDQEVILITADADLWQCLRPNVSIYNPQKKKKLTLAWFLKEYGIKSAAWAWVKALAGCSGDGVKGVHGVGEKTALRMVKFPMKLTAEEKGIFIRNLELVKLPFAMCPVPELKPDNISKKGWQDVCGELGMRSLAGYPPVRVRKGINL